MTTTIYRYYVKHPDNIWVAYNYDNANTFDKIVSDYWDKLKSIDGFNSFKVDFPIDNVMRHIFEFDNDDPIDCFKTFIKVMKDYRDPVVDKYHKYMNENYIKTNTPLPKLFYKVIDNKGNILKFRNVSIR